MSRISRDARRGDARHHASLLLVAATVALLPVLPAALAAQSGPGQFELFASRKEQSAQPLFGGISIARFGGAFGLRLGGAINVVDRNANATTSPGLAFNRGYDGYGHHHHGPGGGGPDGLPGRTSSYDNGLTMPGIAAWSADADLVFEPFRPLPVMRALLLGFSPYAFAGIGGQGLRPSGGPDTTRATMSAGAGVHHQLLGGAGIMAEARYRRALHGDTMSYSTAADIRDRVEYRVGVAIAFGAKHKASAAAAPTSALPSVETPAPVVIVPLNVASVLDLAEGLIETPYRDGGSNPDEGFSAAGFVRYVFGKQGVALPATAREMAREGSPVSLKIGALQPGDLVFFANDGEAIDHVAIYDGHDRIVHASASAGRVQSDVLGEGERGKWFAEHLVAARRITTATAPRAVSGDHDSAPRGGRTP